MKENEEVKEEQKRLEKKKFTHKKKATYFKVKWKEYEEKRSLKSYCMLTELSAFSSGSKLEFFWILEDF